MSCQILWILADNQNDNQRDNQLDDQHDLIATSLPSRLRSTDSELLEGCAGLFEEKENQEGADLSISSRGGQLRQCIEHQEGSDARMPQALGIDRRIRGKSELTQRWL